jgi:hypothetical protein
MANGIGRVGWRNYAAPLTSSIITNGLLLNLDAGNTLSYPGTGTTWTDLSGNGNNATLVNGPAYSSTNGGTMVFDGVNDYAITTNNIGISGNSEVSISTWVKFIELGSGSYGFRTVSMFGNVYSSGGGMGIMHRGNGVISAAFYQGLAATTTTSPITANNWYNITITKSPGAVGMDTTKIYINGILQTLTFNTSITPNFSNMKAYIGNDVASEYSNNMVVGNTLIYNRALTSTEIVTNFDATKSRFGYNYTARTTAFATATGITDTTILNALNTFDTGLISNGLDTKMKALYPFVGGTANTHKYNFMDARDVDVAFRLQFNGGYVHSSTGALPNGTNAYANTFLTPSVNLNVSSNSFGVYSRTENTVVGIYGVFDASSFLQQNFNGNFINGSLSNRLNYTASPSTRLMLASRSNTLFTAYRNGSSIGNNNSFSNNLPNSNFYLFARNYGGPEYYTSHELSFAFLGDGLTSTEVTNFTNLVNTLQTSLSRQV